MDATLQNIFRKNFNRYKQQHGLSMDQHRAAQAIMACRSEELGHEEWVCPNGDHVEYQYHSCRNRSCPRCNGAQTHQWLENTQSRLLPCDHYHVIFTLPHELNQLWQYNRSWCSDRLFNASSETLSQLLADERYLGAKVGMISSLHTWGRTLSFHPHVHVLVSGGGLSGSEWRMVKNDFLLPVGVIKAKFKGKWLSWLNSAYSSGELVLPPEWSEAKWIGLLCRISKKNWNVRIQGGYRHGRGVSNYLSRYVRGGPIKDNRLVRSDEEKVCFRYRDHRDGKDKVMCLSNDDFISRVMWHVPIKGQHNVRYYGLYVPGATEKRNCVRATMGLDEERKPDSHTTEEKHCPDCGEALFHSCSTRRKISYIKEWHVQQGVQDDRDRASLREYWSSVRPPSFFLGHEAVT